MREDKKLYCLVRTAFSTWLIKRNSRITFMIEKQKILNINIKKTVGVGVLIHKKKRTRLLFFFVDYIKKKSEHKILFLI